MLYNYDYDNRTLAQWYTSKVCEDKVSYFQVFKEVETNPEFKNQLIKTMKWIDDQFLNQGRKIDLIKQMIIYVMNEKHAEEIVEKKSFINEIIGRLEVSPRVLEQATKNGAQSTLEAEISWEMHHLVEEGALENPSTGYYKLA